MKRATALLLLCLAASAHAAAQTPRARRPPPAFDGDPFAAALRVVSRMEPESAGRERLFVSLVGDYVRAGRLDDARRALSAMEEDDAKAFLLVEVAGGMAESNRLEEAAELAASALEILGWQVSPDDACWAALRQLTGHVEHTAYEVGFKVERRKGVVARLVEANRAAAAAELLEAAREVVLDPEYAEGERPAVVLTFVSERYAEMGDAARAAEALAEAASAARRAEDDADRADALCVVAKTHVAAGRSDEALKLLAEAFDAGSSPRANGGTSLREVAALYTRLGMKERAREAAAALADEEDRAAALAGIERAEQAASGRVEDTAQSHAHALDAVAASDSGEYGKWLALRQLLDAAPVSPDVFARAAHAARSLRDPYHRAYLLCQVADRHRDAGRGDEALELWGESFETLHSVDLLKVKYGPGDVRIDNDAQKVELLRALGQRFLRAGRADRLAEAARAIEANYWKALTVADGSAASVAPADLALAGLADELLRAGRREESLEMLAAAARVARHEGENVWPTTRVEALAAIASVYARAGDHASAADHFLRALQSTAVLAGEYPGDERAALLSRIGTRYAEAGLKPDPRARRTLRRIVRDIEKEL